jgi:hypothetical protein
LQDWPASETFQTPATEPTVTSGPVAEATCVFGVVGAVAVVGAAGADGKAEGSVTGGVIGFGADGAGSGAEETVPAGAAATGAGPVSIPLMRSLWQPANIVVTSATAVNPPDIARILYSPRIIPANRTKICHVLLKICNSLKGQIAVNATPTRYFGHKPENYVRFMLPKCDAGEP